MMRCTWLLGVVLACAFGTSAATPATDARALQAAADLIVAEAGDHRVILLGEMHGTREAPRLVSRLASTYAAKQRPVGVVLELDAKLTPILADYLDSDGGAQARTALLAWPYWHVEPARSDGRRNLELIALLEDLRKLRAGGAEVVVLGIDNPPFGKPDSQARDQAMAGRLLDAMRGSTRSQVLVLTGNVHAMHAKPSYAPPEMQSPMGSYLTELRPFSVDIAARGGQYWACAGGPCGAVEHPAGFKDSERLGPGEAFDLRVVLPSFSLAELITGGAATADAQAKEFLQRLESDPDDEWLEDDGQTWLGQLSPETKLRIAELGMASGKTKLQGYGPILLYSMGLDERGDAAIADLWVHGVEAGLGLAWGWIHSGDATLYERRMAGIQKALRARYADLTPEQRKLADKLLCEEGKDCERPGKHPE